jgi:hypothetical protein
MVKGCSSAMDRLSGDCMGGGPSPGSKLPDTSRGGGAGGTSRFSSGSGGSRPGTPPQSSSGVSMPATGGIGASGNFGGPNLGSSGTIKMGPPAAANAIKQQLQPQPQPKPDSYYFLK